MNEKFIPLVYLIVIAGIAAGFQYLGVAESITMLIIGAGITRVRIGDSGKKIENGKGPIDPK